MSENNNPSNQDEHKLVIVGDEEKTEHQIYVEEEERKHAIIVAKQNDELKLSEERDRRKNVKEILDSHLRSLVADAEATVKFILALNKVLDREYEQYDLSSLEGMSYLYGSKDLNLLVSNGHLPTGHNGITDKRRAYISLNPSDLMMENGSSISDILANVLSPFRMYNQKVLLCVYINTTEFSTYESIKKIVESELGEEQEYEFVSMLSNMHHMREAEVQLLHKDSTIHIGSIASRGLVRALGLSADRHKKIYFSPEFVSGVRGVGLTDFHILTLNSFANPIISFQNMHELNTSADAMPVLTENYEEVARQVKDYWLTTKTDFKFMHEIIEDFYNCPTTVRIDGLSPLFGIINKKELQIKGIIYNMDSDQEATFEEVFIEKDAEDPNHILWEKVTDEDILTKYLMKDFRNLRSSLVYMTKNKVKFLVRVDSIKPILTVYCRSLQTNSNETLVITNMDNVRFLCDYYYKDVYTKFNSLNYPHKHEYAVPPGLVNYLVRKASKTNMDLVTPDTKWFSRLNQQLPQVLKLLGRKVDLQHIIGDSISVLDGILRYEITVNLEGLICHTQKN